MNDTKSFLKLSIFILLLASLSAGFFAGIASVSINGECEYRSIISYYPSRIISCELFEQRW